MKVNIKSKIKSAVHKKVNNELIPELIHDFKLKTANKNQLVAFLKPENFLDKTEDQINKIIDLVLSKFEKYGISIDGAAIFPGPALEKFRVMDKHYGVINTLSKSASKSLSKEDRQTLLSTFGIDNRDIKIMGGHEAMSFAAITDTKSFDQKWLEVGSTKIRSGFYARPMTLKKETVIVVNGFHPHQLAHYTANGRKLAVMLVSSNTSWGILRDEMIGSTFPEKADLKSIRGTMHKKARDYGFESVRIENNIIHLSAGPTEALFEMNNFFNESFGIDVATSDAKLASKLAKSGLTKDQIKAVMVDSELHSILEHKDTSLAVKEIKKKFKPKAS